MTAYLAMWLRYCKENSIWFAVCPNGVVDEVTDTERGTEAEAPSSCVFGSKAAYEWLIRWHTVIKVEGKEE